jgi:hypothetical protein
MAVLFWYPTPASPSGTLGFDVTSSEAVEITATVTKHPVEVGADVTDHIRKNLDEVTLEVFVSNTPLTNQNFVDPDQPRGGTNSPLLLDAGAPYSPPGAPPQTPIDVAVYIPPPFSLGALVSDVAKLTFAAPPVTAALGIPARLAPDTYAQVLQFGDDFSATIETYDVLTQLQIDGTLVSVVLRDSVHDNMIVTGISKPRTNEDGDGARFTVKFEEIRIVQTQTTSSPVPAEVRAKSPVTAGSTGAKTADPSKASVASGLLTAAKAALPSLAGLGL